MRGIPPRQPGLARRAHWNNQLERHASVQADRAAIRFEGVTTSWAVLRRRVHALAGALARRRVSSGDRVALIMGNRLIGEPGEPHAPVDVPEDSPALIMYTSGTTGKPKGAVLTYLNLQVQAMTAICGFQHHDEDDAVLIASPLFHIAGIGSCVPVFLLGGTTVIMPTGAFDPARLLTILAEEDVTSVFLVPTQWQSVCDGPLRAGVLHATARPVHAGRTLIVVGTDLTDDQQRLIAQTSQAQAIIWPDSRERRDARGLPVGLCRPPAG